MKRGPQQVYGANVNDGDKAFQKRCRGMPVVKRPPIVFVLDALPLQEWLPWALHVARMIRFNLSFRSLLHFTLRGCYE
jgi:hypothetical protein